MPDIDYEALGIEGGKAFDDVGWTFAENMTEVARAVVAAYQAQMRARGVVEVRRELLDLARSSLATHENYSGMEIFQKEVDEIDAILSEGAEND